LSSITHTVSFRFALVCLYLSVVDTGCETEQWASAWSRRTSVTDAPPESVSSFPGLQESRTLTSSESNAGTTAHSGAEDSISVASGSNSTYSTHVDTTSPPPPPLGRMLVPAAVQLVDYNGQQPPTYQNGQVLSSAHWHAVTMPPQSNSGHAMMINRAYASNPPSGYSVPPSAGGAYDTRSSDSLEKTVTDHETAAADRGASVKSIVGLLPTPRPGEPSGFGQRYLMPADAVLVRPRLPMGPPPPLMVSAPGMLSHVSSQSQFADFHNPMVSSCTNVASSVSEAALVYSTPSVVYAGSAAALSHQYLFPPPPPKSAAGVNMSAGMRGDYTEGSAPGMISYYPSAISIDQWNVDASSNPGINSMVYIPRYYPFPPTFAMNHGPMWQYSSSYPLSQGPPPPQGMGLGPHGGPRMMLQGLPPPLIASQLPPPVISQLLPQHSLLGPQPPSGPPMISMISQQQRCPGGGGAPNGLSSNSQSPDEDDETMQVCRQCGQLVNVSAQSVPTPVGNNGNGMLCSSLPPTPSCYRPSPGLSMPVNNTYIGPPPPPQAPPQALPMQSFRPMSSIPTTQSNSDNCPPNGISCELRFPSSAYLPGCHGSRPPVPSSFTVPPPPPPIHCRPPVELTCCGCGGAGHRFLDCKESTGDSSLQGTV